MSIVIQTIAAKNTMEPVTTGVFCIRMAVIMRGGVPCMENTVSMRMAPPRSSAEVYAQGGDNGQQSVLSSCLVIISLSLAPLERAVRT